MNPESKSAIRKKVKAERSKLSKNEQRLLSQKIINRLWEIVDWQKIRSIHVYLPLHDQNEIDTLPFLRAARQQNPELKIATSWRERSSSLIKTSWLNDEFRIAKPAPSGFHYGLIIVPMLAFDSGGYRLGYGGGFYDRFLAPQDDALRVGLCYESGRHKQIPPEQHDIPMDLIITEKNIYKF